MSPSDELELNEDGFGFDPEFTERVTKFALWMYRNYWRVEADGVTNVPDQGRALLVANHAGIVPYDGAMIRTAIIADHPHPRHARMLVVDWAFAVPFTNMLLVKTGNVLAHPDNATALLERDELVGVFPEGVKGAAKRYRDRYRIRRLGRGGFVQVALRTNTSAGFSSKRIAVRTRSAPMTGRSASSSDSSPSTVIRSRSTSSATRTCVRINATSRAG